MPLPYEIMSGLVDVCSRDMDISPEEREHLIRLTGVVLNTFYDGVEISGDRYIAYLEGLKQLCSAINAEKSRALNELESRIRAECYQTESNFDEIYSSIYNIAGSKDPKRVRQILTAIVNCEPSSVPAEVRDEFRSLQKAFGLDRVLEQ